MHTIYCYNEIITTLKSQIHSKQAQRKAEREGCPPFHKHTYTQKHAHTQQPGFRWAIRGKHAWACPHSPKHLGSSLVKYIKIELNRFKKTFGCWYENIVPLFNLTFHIILIDMHSGRHSNA